MEHEKSYFHIFFVTKIKVYKNMCIIYVEIGFWCSYVFSCSKDARGKVTGIYHPSTSPSLIPVKMRLFAMRSMSLVTLGNAAVICCTKFF